MKEDKKLLLEGVKKEMTKKQKKDFVCRWRKKMLNSINTTVGVKVSPILKAKLNKRCKEKDIGISEFVRGLIEEGLK